MNSRTLLFSKNPTYLPYPLPPPGALFPSLFSNIRSISPQLRALTPCPQAHYTFPPLPCLPLGPAQSPMTLLFLLLTHIPLKLPLLLSLPCPQLGPLPLAQFYHTPPSAQFPHPLPLLQTAQLSLPLPFFRTSPPLLIPHLLVAQPLLLVLLHGPKIMSSNPTPNTSTPPPLAPSPLSLKLFPKPSKTLFGDKLWKKSFTLFTFLVHGT